jgi:hypothetical protein
MANPTESALSASAADALSGTTDSLTGATYNTIGQSTYYTAAYQKEAIWNRAMAVANQLRVVKTGDLTYGVWAGNFMDGATPRTYAGSTGNALTDAATNYIYLTAAGTLTKNTTGFPTDENHVPLATIVTSGGAYAQTDITDYRGRAFIEAVGGRGSVELNLAIYTSPNVLTAAETGKTLHNTGATEVNYHTLPAAAAGLEFRFCDVAGAKMLIAAAAGDTIRVETGVTVAGGTISSEAAAAGVHLVAIDATQWVAISKNGSWVIDT